MVFSVQILVQKPNFVISTEIGFSYISQKNIWKFMSIWMSAKLVKLIWFICDNVKTSLKMSNQGYQNFFNQNFNNSLSKSLESYLGEKGCLWVSSTNIIRQWGQQYIKFVFGTSISDFFLRYCIKHWNGLLAKKTKFDKPMVKSVIVVLYDNTTKISLKFRRQRMQSR